MPGITNFSSIKDFSSLGKFPHHIGIYVQINNLIVSWNWTPHSFDY